MSFQIASIFGSSSGSTGGDASANPLASVFSDAALQKYARVYKPAEVEKTVEKREPSAEEAITGGKKKRKKRAAEAAAAAAALLAAQSPSEEKESVSVSATTAAAEPVKEAKKAKREAAVPVKVTTKEESKEDANDNDNDEEAAAERAAAQEAESAQKEQHAHRTLFVGNIPIKETVDSIKKLFSAYGAIDSVRMRSVPVAGAKVDKAGNQELVKKVCVTQSKFGDQKGSYNAYIVFKEESSVAAARILNNTLLGERHLRVDSAVPTLFDPKRSVFVGGLPYYADEEEVRKFFAEVLENGQEDIEGVRLVRDPETLVGKGIGYVLLKERDCVAKALTRNAAVYKKRWTLRVQSCGKRTKRQGKDKPQKDKKKDNPALKRIKIKGAVTKKKLLESRKKSNKAPSNKSSKPSSKGGKPNKKSTGKSNKPVKAARTNKHKDNKGNKGSKGGKGGKGKAQKK